MSASTGIDHVMPVLVWIYCQYQYGHTHSMPILEFFLLLLVPIPVRAFLYVCQYWYGTSNASTGTDLLPILVWVHPVGVPTAYCYFSFAESYDQSTRWKYKLNYFSVTAKDYLSSSLASSLASLLLFLHLWLFRWQAKEHLRPSLKQLHALVWQADLQLQITPPLP